MLVPRDPCGPPIRCRPQITGPRPKADQLLPGEHSHGLAFQVDVGIAADVDRDLLDRAAGERVRVRTGVVTGDRFAAVPADA